MYKVLLVDDEQIIREGIASVIDWESFGFSLIGIAQNGIEAYEAILKDHPAIVITDIKMPIVDGLELIRKTKEISPEIVFIVLSGYDEFALAKEAMRHGVKHYLLKPCSEKNIIDVLNDVRQELLHLEEKEEHVNKSKENFERVIPLVREQFLRNFITSRNYTKDESEYYFKLLKIEDIPIRLLLIQPEREYVYEEMFELLNIVNNIFSNHCYFSTIIKNQILILTYSIINDELFEIINQMKKIFLHYYHLELSIGYSDIENLKDSSIIYKEVQECLKFSFYHRLVKANFERIITTHNRLIKIIVNYIHNNIDNEDLTLKRLANELVYMNVSYLSKLFIKEIGEKFSHYVMVVRMEKARELIEKSDDDLIYEVARKVGLGNNPQYFSQIFKKYTGFAPSEYKKSLSR